jgi:glycosyltransferase involved in cell wall biosynthesis
MKVAYKIINGFFLTIACSITLGPLLLLRLDQYPEKPIVVIIPSYKNERWVEKNLTSVFNQKYKNYRVIYIDDCSPDSTYMLAHQVTARFNQKDRTTILHNETRKGAMANWYNAIHSCNNNEIVIQLDGDDWLAHDHVLAYINSVYADENIWLTYGQFKEYPSGRIGILYNKYFPRHVIESNTQRTYKHLPMSHLRTCYAWLFKLIKIEDLMYEGNFYPMACDKALLAPMIEMAGNHYACLSEILYIYNNSNPINVHRINMPQQHAIAEHIAHQTPYKPLTVAQYNAIMHKNDNT